MYFCILQRNFITRNNMSETSSLPSNQTGLTTQNSQATPLSEVIYHNSSFFVIISSTIIDHGDVHSASSVAPLRIELNLYAFPRPFHYSFRFNQCLSGNTYCYAHGLMNFVNTTYACLTLWSS